MNLDRIVVNVDTGTTSATKINNNSDKIELELDKKLDKVTTTGSLRAYTVDTNGETQGTINIVANSATPMTLPERNVNGTFSIGEPLADDNPATKLYVDLNSASKNAIAITDWDTIPLPLPTSREISFFTAGQDALNRPDGMGSMIAHGAWQPTATDTSGLFILQATGIGTGENGIVFTRTFNQSTETWASFRQVGLGDGDTFPEPPDDGLLYGRVRAEDSPAGEWKEIPSAEDLISEDTDNALTSGNDGKLFVPAASAGGVQSVGADGTILSADGTVTDRIINPTQRLTDAVESAETAVQPEDVEDVIRSPNETILHSVLVSQAEYEALLELSETDPEFKLIFDKTNYKTPEDEYDFMQAVEQQIFITTGTGTEFIVNSENIPTPTPNGYAITIIPHVSSETINATLQVNDGAPIQFRFALDTNSLRQQQIPQRADFLTAGIPVRLVHDPSANVASWRIEGMQATNIPVEDSAVILTSGGAFTALEGKEDVTNKVVLSRTSTATEYPNAESVINYIDLALETIPPGGLRIPVSIELESELDKLTLTVGNVGDYYFVQDMDVTAPGRNGRAWVNFENNDPENPIVIYKVYNQRYGADGKSIILTPAGELSVSSDWATAAQVGTTNPNILHNWDFANVINQRAQSEYHVWTSGNRYTIDRWMIVRASLEIINGGIRLSRGAGFDTITLFEQVIDRVDNYRGKEITFTAVTGNGVFTITRIIPADSLVWESFANMEGTIFSIGFRLDVVNQRLFFRIFTTTLLQDSTHLDIYRVKVEMGAVSTLVNDPPMDFDRELIVCQRHFERIYVPRSTPFLTVFTSENRNMFGGVLQFNRKRIVPTIRFTGLSEVRLTRALIVLHPIDEILITLPGESFAFINVPVSVSAQVLASDAAIFGARSTGSFHIDIDANL